jgi:uncharacterized membrane protein YeaQ/YmgE (transglycosylase-associated protein family)
MEKKTRNILTIIAAAVGAVVAFFVGKKIVKKAKDK